MTGDHTMSLDSSLKSGSGLAKHRNVLTRAERLEKLSTSGGFNADEDEVLGLPKVANRKVVTGGKTKKADPAEAVEGDAAPTEEAAS
ncbi:MAG: small basic protein [Phycisphaeraceae bacterium]|nr:small basic protein [Phycisphaeraceae bacterium]